MPQSKDGIAGMGGMDGLAGMGGRDGMGGIGGIEGEGRIGPPIAPDKKATASPL